MVLPKSYDNQNKMSPSSLYNALWSRFDNCAWFLEVLYKQAENTVCIHATGGTLYLTPFQLQSFEEKIMAYLHLDWHGVGHEFDHDKVNIAYSLSRICEHASQFSQHLTARISRQIQSS